MTHGTAGDVLVVGGGPAGSVTSLLLARRGHRVILLDRARFPRPKACGETINPGAVGLLARYSLLDRVLGSEPAPLYGWSVGIPSGPGFEARFDRRGTSTDRPGSRVERSRIHGLGLPRASLDAALLAAARTEGVEVVEGARVSAVSSVTPGDVEVRVRMDGASRDCHLRARSVVGADGLRSLVARTIGARANPRGPRKLSLSGRVFGAGPDPTIGILRIDDGLTVGLAPVREGGGAWNATVVVDPGVDGAEVRAGPAAFLADRLCRVGIDWAEAPALEGPPLASGPFVRPTRWAARGRVFLVGDAAGYYDPLTGQGVYRALCGAELCAAAVHSALTGPVASWERAAAAYSRELDRSFRIGRSAQRAIECVLRPTASRALAMTALGHLPRVARSLIRLVGDTTSLSVAPTSLAPEPVHAHR